MHPFYSSKHEQNHKPVLGRGVAVKTNAGQRYTSDSVGTFIIKQLAAMHGRTMQQYEVPNDMFVHILLSFRHLTDTGISARRAVRLAVR